MERGRKTKVITIIALVVAIVTMSIGFAVFSNVLTISSSATVKPNADDYVVNIYGVAEEIPEDVINSGEFADVLPYINSKTTSIALDPAILDSNLLMAYDASQAVVDNKNFVISNLNVTFSSTDQGALYVFMIKNEGKNNVYINFNNFVREPNTCVAKEGTNQLLVDEDCAKIQFLDAMLSSDGEAIALIGKNDVLNSYEIIPNDFVFLLISASSSYGENFIADGEFMVNIGDIKYEFSSVGNSQNS